MIDNVSIRTSALEGSFGSGVSDAVGKFGAPAALVFFLEVAPCSYGLERDIARLAVEENLRKQRLLYQSIWNGLQVKKNYTALFTLVVLSVPICTFQNERVVTTIIFITVM